MTVREQHPRSHHEGATSMLSSAIWGLSFAESSRGVLACWQRHRTGFHRSPVLTPPYQAAGCVCLRFSLAAARRGPLLFNPSSPTRKALTKAQHYKAISTFTALVRRKSTKQHCSRGPGTGAHLEPAKLCVWEPGDHYMYCPVLGLDEAYEANRNDKGLSGRRTKTNEN